MTTPTRLLRLPEVIARTGMSRSAVYAASAKGAFPQPVKLSERSSAWVESEIDAWLASRVAQRDAMAA